MLLRLSKVIIFDYQGAFHRKCSLIIFGTSPFPQKPKTQAMTPDDSMNYPSMRVQAKRHGALNIKAPSKAKACGKIFTLKE
jgi:hypothetical protein